MINPYNPLLSTIFSGVKHTSQIRHVPCFGRQNVGKKIFSRVMANCVTEKRFLDSVQERWHPRRQSGQGNKNV